jgi:hypothetical protein
LIRDLPHAEDKSVVEPKAIHRGSTYSSHLVFARANSRPSQFFRPKSTPPPTASEDARIIRETAMSIAGFKAASPCKKVVVAAGKIAEAHATTKAVQRIYLLAIEKLMGPHNSPTTAPESITLTAT